jgi:hypothetical protein
MIGESKMSEQEIFENRITDFKCEENDCEECCESVVFALRDNKGNNFSMGVKTMIECLAAAIENNAAPKIPAAWWDRMDRRYGTHYAQKQSVSEWNT